MTDFAAVVLAGGAARRMGGLDKPALPVGGRAMRDRVLDAVGDAEPRVLVGPVDDPARLPAGVRVTREQPVGGGPVAAAEAGLALLGPETETVALLAADLPLLTRPAIADLRRRLATATASTATATASTATATVSAVRGGADGAGYVDAPAVPGGVDGVCYVDADGRRQLLCGVWRVAPLRAATERLRASRGGSLAGASVRALLAGLVLLDLPWSGAGPPPWFDCDTDDDLRRAEEWTR